MSGLLSRLRKISLKFKLILLFIVSILILIGTALFTVRTVVTKSAKDVAVDKAKTDLKTGYEILDREYPGEWRLEGDKLYKGDTLINNNFEMVDHIGRLTNDTVTVFAKDTRVATNVKKNGERAVGTTVSQEVGNVVLENGDDYYGEADVVGHMYQTAYTPIENAEGEIIGIWYVGAPQAFVNQMIKDIFIQVSIVISITAVILLFGVYFMSNKVVNPILNAVDFAKKIATGNFDISDLDVKAKDEIGSLAEALNKMKFELNQVLNKVKKTALQVTNASDEIADGNQDLSQRTQEQASSLEEVSATLEEITSSIQEVANNSNRADDLSDETMEAVQHGSQVVDETMDSMEEITSSSQEVAEIITTVNYIAFQTNLLALNAAVEAARAGEHGQGFAVVAAEVRNLASQTAESADEIENLISRIIDQIEEGNELVEETERALDEITENSKNASQAISEIASAMEEQSSAANQIQGAVDELDEVTQQNSSMVEEIASSSEALEGEANDLAEVVNKFNLDNNQQLEKINHNSKQQPSNQIEKSQSRSQNSGINDLESEMDSNFNADDFEKF
ncbi:MAG: methyl-accepting chemotaxis protein [Halanaerobacter sp.]